MFEYDADLYFELPTIIFSDSDICQISSGENHLLILVNSGDVYGFGCNNWGQLGINDTNFVTTVRKIPINNIKCITSMDIATISLTNDNKIIVCGWNGEEEIFSVKNKFIICNPYTLNISGKMLSNCSTAIETWKPEFHKRFDGQFKANVHCLLNCLYVRRSTIKKVAKYLIYKIVAECFNNYFEIKR